MISGGDTVTAARIALSAAFRGAGLDSPAADARVLIQHTLGLTHAALVADGARVLTAGEAVAVNAAASRRLAQEPVAYIVGEKEFWGLELTVTSATLIPRPDTETLVQAVLDALGPRANEHLQIADLGTGSGAILIALLHSLPDAEGIGIDVSFGAVSVARANAARHALAARSAFAVGDLVDALDARPTFDVIVSNPPYIESGTIADLSPGVRMYEPVGALDGGMDGLTFYRRVVREGAALLKAGGVLGVEIGAGQADAVSGLFAGAGWQPAARPARDLEGHVRALLFVHE
ncbi:MAG: peptide chain release factor N(5)-glutamine methyltransferase [Rhizobiales bacterium]|nr:peptide chain release factor N(5)-glutamine methyltransferase [Hyphomicrobiales bacterium]